MFKKYILGKKKIVGVKIYFVYTTKNFNDKHLIVYSIK